MSRPILPSTQVDGAQPPDSPNSSQDPTSPGPSKPSYSKRGRITIVACVPCRKRKTKCDGKRPRCGQCTARDGECIYDMTDDQRKLTYLRDHSEKLEAQHTALKALINALQTSEEEDAQHILRRIRGGENVLTVADQVQAGKVLVEASRQETGQSAASAYNHTDVSSPNRMRAKIAQYERLLQLMSNNSTSFSKGIITRLKSNENVDAILQAVDSGDDAFQRFSPDNSEKLPGIYMLMGGNSPFPPTPKPQIYPPKHADQHPVARWTEITSDDELLGHLMGLYFTWQHAFFQNFPEHLFHRDYVSKQTKFCSKALVSAICASGCFLSGREALRADCQGDQVFVSGFFDEAMKHLNDLEEPDLPNTAAMYLVSFVEGYRGNRSGQWLVGGRSALMALDLRLHLPTQQREPIDEADDEELQNEALARSHAFWGCFHVMQCNSLTLERLPIFHHQSVSIDLPQPDHRADVETWKSYEMAITNRPGARATVFQKCAELSLIANAMQLMFYAPTERLTAARLVAMHEQYLDWYENLSPMVRIVDQGQDPPPPPHIICLHLYYNCAVLLLFRPFLTFTISNSRTVPREVCQKAANTISNLWTLHRRLFGTSGIWQFQLNCLLAASTIHILYLSDPSSVSHLTHACNTFQELQSWQGWAREALGILRARTKEWNLTLPRDVAQALFNSTDGIGRAHVPSAQSQSDRMLPPTATSDNGPRRGRMSNENYTDAAYHADQTYHFQPATQGASQQNSGRGQDATRSPKRASESASSSSASQQKRQRVTSPPQSQAGRSRNVAQQSAPLVSTARNNMAPGVANQPPRRLSTSLTPISRDSQSAQHSPINIQQHQTGPMAHYIYNPSGQAPMLQPAGPQILGQLHIPAGRMRTANQPRQAHSTSDAFDTQARYNQQSRPESRSGESASASGVSPMEDHALHSSVEGLTFAEDWRVPYMGGMDGRPPDQNQHQRRQ